MDIQLESNIPIAIFENDKSKTISIDLNVKYLFDNKEQEDLFNQANGKQFMNLPLSEEEDRILMQTYIVYLHVAKYEEDISDRTCLRLFQGNKYAVFYNNYILLNPGEKLYLVCKDNVKFRYNFIKSIIR